jgi:hypothetical protein
MFLKYFRRLASSAADAAVRTVDRIRIIPAFIKKSVERAGLPLQVAFIIHVLLYILVNHVAASLVAASSDLRLSFNPNGAVDWARTGWLHSSDCSLDISTMKTVKATIDFYRVNELERRMPAKWCLPPPSAEKRVSEEALKLERLSNFMKDEATLHGMRVLGAFEVNVNVHAVLVDGQLMLNPQLVGIDSPSECTVTILGKRVTVPYYKRSNVVFKTFFGDTVTRMVSKEYACLLAAF